MVTVCSPIIAPSTARPRAWDQYKLYLPSASVTPNEALPLSGAKAIFAPTNGCPPNVTVPDTFLATLRGRPLQPAVVRTLATKQHRQAIAVRLCTKFMDSREGVVGQRTPEG